MTPLRGLSENKDCRSEGLGWGLRFCLPHRLPGNTAAFGLRNAILRSKASDITCPKHNLWANVMRGRTLTRNGTSPWPSHGTLLFSHFPHAAVLLGRQERGAGTGEPPEDWKSWATSGSSTMTRSQSPHEDEFPSFLTHMCSRTVLLSLCALNSQIL